MQDLLKCKPRAVPGNPEARNCERKAGGSKMKLLEKGLSTAAVIAALSTLACCVPLGFLGALGLASLSVWAQPLRPWLLGASVVLLAVGFVQLHVRRSTCARRSAASLVIFWTATVIVLLIILFPQIVASLIAR